VNKHEKIFEEIFGAARSIQTEVLIFSGEEALTRFSENAISQNVLKSFTEVSVRFIDRGRVVKTSVNPSRDIRKQVHKALTLLSLQKKGSHIPPLIKGDYKFQRTSRFFPSTASLSPEFRALEIRKAAKKCAERKQTCCGIFASGWRSLTVANNVGIRKNYRESFASFEITVTDGKGFGWAQKTSRNAKDIDYENAFETASLKAKMGRNPREIKPGKYTVVLEPAAAADILSFIIYYGFGSRNFAEGRSFVSGKLGKKIFARNISIYDDAHAGPSTGMPFDYEGAQRKRLKLIENGFVREVPMDRKTAPKTGMKSTGHSLPQPHAAGAVCANATLAPGNSSLAEIIKNTEKGIYVTQIPYTNLLRQIPPEITGMTRNGTYMIENGKIKHAVKNMRFTENILNVFNNVDLIGNSLETFFEHGFLLSAPALRIRNFNFSSATKF